MSAVLLPTQLGWHTLHNYHTKFNKNWLFQKFKQKGTQAGNILDSKANSWAQTKVVPSVIRLFVCMLQPEDHYEKVQGRFTGEIYGKLSRCRNFCC
jgi:hypothetical protein